jgi:hypothetical protein
MEFAMDAFIGFMNTPVGRIARIVAGLALVGCGLFALGGTVGYIVAAVGLIPLVFGSVRRCMVEFIAPHR